jgi:hypothetical protein
MPHEVDGPTYEVVGRVQRYDERDNVFSREYLLPGSLLERQYHADHPHLEETDHRLAKHFFDQAGASSVPAEKVAGAALAESTFRAVSALALPDAVDGPLAPGEGARGPD